MLRELERIASRWWMPWEWRRTEAGKMLATLRDDQVAALYGVATSRYWSPGRRVDQLIWQLVDEERYSRGISKVAG